MTDSEVAGDSPPAPPRRRPRWLVLGLAVALVGACVALGLTWRKASDRDELLTAATSAETAGRSAAVHMTTYDYRTLDQDFAWVVNDGTASFADSFKDASDSVRELAESTQARSEGTVIASAPDVSDATHARVLAFVDQTISEVGKKKPILQRWRIQLTLVHQHGRWLVDDLKLL